VSLPEQVWDHPPCEKLLECENRETVCGRVTVMRVGAAFINSLKQDKKKFNPCLIRVSHQDLGRERPLIMAWKIKDKKSIEYDHWSTCKWVASTKIDRIKCNHSHDLWTKVWLKSVPKSSTSINFDCYGQIVRHPKDFCLFWYQIFLLTAESQDIWHFWILVNPS